jgi:molecular chaperone DnaJ
MTSKRPDLYAILEVSPHATQAEIGHAYRSLLRRHHPDTRAPVDESHSASSDAALQLILAAYTVLRDRPAEPTTTGRSGAVHSHDPGNPRSRSNTTAHTTSRPSSPAPSTGSVEYLERWESRSDVDTARGLRRLSRPCPSRWAMLLSRSLGRSTERSPRRRSANGPARPLRGRWDSPRTPRTTSSDGITRDGASATWPRNAV